MLLLCANRSFLPSPSLLLFLPLTKPAVGEGLHVGNFANSVFWTESLTRAKLGKVTGDAAIAARFLTGPQSDFDSSGNFDRFRLPLPSIVVCQAAIHRVCYSVSTVSVPLFLIRRLVCDPKWQTSSVLSA